MSPRSRQLIDIPHHRVYHELREVTLDYVDSYVWSRLKTQVERGVPKPEFDLTRQVLRVLTGEPPIIDWAGDANVFGFL